jgi:hypothetical protein
MSELVEILFVSLPRELRPYSHQQRFATYLHGQQVGELTTYDGAVRAAAALGDGTVFFVPEDYEPVSAPAVKPDYGDLVPSYLSRRKKK